MNNLLYACVCVYTYEREEGMRKGKKADRAMRILVKMQISKDIK